MIFEDEKEEYIVTYRVIDLIKDKYNKSFTHYNNAVNHCKWCLKNGATALMLITNECITTYEKVSLGGNNHGKED